MRAAPFLIGITAVAIGLMLLFHEEAATLSSQLAEAQEALAQSQATLAAERQEHLNQLAALDKLLRERSHVRTDFEERSRQLRDALDTDGLAHVPVPEHIRLRLQWRQAGQSTRAPGGTAGGH